MTRPPLRSLLVILVLLCGRGRAAPASAPAAVGEPAPVVLRLTLAEAIARAQATSPHLGQLHELEKAAAAGLDQSRSERLPSIDAVLGYTRLSDVPELAILSPGGPRQVIFPNLPDNWHGRLSLSLPLYTGGRIGSGIDAALAERAAAASDALAGGADLVLETAEAYWRLVTARERTRVLGEALQAYDAHRKQTRDRADEGMSAANEVLAVEVERARAELARLQARNAAAAAGFNLARLLGLAAGVTVDPVEAMSLPPPAEEGEALVARALALRPEHRALASRLAAAEARVEVESGSRLPQIDLTAGYDYANPNRRILPPEDTFRGSWDASINLSLAVFDGGRIGSAVARARAEAAAIRHQLEDLEGRIRLEVETRRLDLETAIAASAVADQAVDSGKESLRVASDRYHEGLIASAELLDAESALLQASLDAVSARVLAHLARAGLERATGPVDVGDFVPVVPAPPAGGP